jgi:hypothetical protein
MQNSVDYWLEKIMSLQKFDLRQAFRLPDLYKFAYRVTQEEQERYNFQNWRAFKPISQKDKALLNLEGDLYPIFVNDGYIPYNFAGLVRRI